MNKKAEISYGIMQIESILHMIRPEKKWEILWKKIDDEAWNLLSDWQKKYHDIIKNQEYFLIFDECGTLLYVLNVSAESTLYSLSNLMKLLADKF